MLGVLGAGASQQIFVTILRSWLLQIWTGDGVSAMGLATVVGGLDWGWHRELWQVGIMEAG